MAKDSWNPRQYERFRAERRQPFDDLVRLIRPRPALRIADLGCGTGELSRELHLALRARETRGIDRSKQMLERAISHIEPDLSFECRAIEDFSGGPFDLLFSNAALHWVPDHEKLFERLSKLLAPMGQLAVQMPANNDHASHECAAKVAREEPFRSLLGGFVRASPVLPPESYALLLKKLDFAEQHVRLQVYLHELTSTAEIAEWTRGTTLTAYEEKLPPADFEKFLERYRERLLARLGDQRPFLFTFKRILLWAQKP